MNFFKQVTILLFFWNIQCINAQIDSTTRSHDLKEVQIQSIKNDVKSTMQEQEMGVLLEGKKSEVINIEKLNANISNNQMRQIISRIPGIHVWEIEGNGIQVGIATRGLNPNRNWDFNVRQNGYDISADPLGYPEAYYNPTMNAVSELQLLRGSASLAYGTQFGGLLNYKLRGPIVDKKIQTEFKFQSGSNNTINTFLFAGGTLSKFKYAAYYDFRRGDGWRNNSKYSVHHAHLHLGYDISKKVSWFLESTFSTYVTQQAGGLTDTAFLRDPKQSVRSRNWFNTPWSVTHSGLKIQLKENHRLEIGITYLHGERNSIGNTASILTPDTKADGSFVNRTVQQDFYNNVSAEMRYMGSYAIGKAKAVSSAGIRYFNGNTERVRGKGDAGTDLNVHYYNGYYGSQYFFKNHQAALYFEQRFEIGKWSISPGIRYEFIRSTSKGKMQLYSADSSKNAPLQTFNRHIVIAGLSSALKLHKAFHLYANANRAYKAFTFADITLQATTDSINPNIKDATGWNVDIGVKGDLASIVHYDISFFSQWYQNRVGSYAFKDGSQTRLYRTNVGNSRSMGVESYIEITPLRKLKKKCGDLSVYNSLSYTNAIYTKLNANENGSSAVTELQGKKVENAPVWISRSGLNYTYGIVSITVNHTYVSSAFSDVLNTKEASANGQIGIIPAYCLLDISAACRLKNHIVFSAGINNVGNKAYYTRRASGYPGPGILPGDGRTFYVSFAWKWAK